MALDLLGEIAGGGTYDNLLPQTDLTHHFSAWRAPADFISVHCPFLRNERGTAEWIAALAAERVAEFRA